MPGGKKAKNNSRERQAFHLDAAKKRVSGKPEAENATSRSRATESKARRARSDAPPSGWGLGALAPLIVLLLAIIGTSALRIRLLQMPLERDEGEYALAGQLILDGHAPYDRLYNMKWPGTYYAYAAIEAIFGQSVAGIHWGLLLVNIAAIILVFLIGRRLFDSMAGAAAAVAYALLSVSPTTLGFAGHATHFVVLAALLAVFCLQRAIERERMSLYFVTGLFAGLAPVMKQPGIVFTAFVLAYWFWHELRSTQSDWSEKIKRGAALCGGIVIPLLVTLASVWVTATEDNFWQWTILYARYYGIRPTLDALASMPHHFLTAWLDVAGSAVLFWIVSGLGLFALPFCPRTRAASAFLLGLLLFSFLGLLPGLVFRPHYFIVVLPVAALLFGVAVFELRQFIGSRLPGIATIGTAALIAVPLLAALWQEREFYFRMTPNEIVAQEYPLAPFLQSVRIADYIREHTEPSDSIAVIGSEPEIYFYAQRLPATGHAYMYAMMEQQPYAHAFQEQMIREIVEAAPKYVVLVKMADSWLRRPNSDMTLLAWFDKYAARHLKTVGIVDTDRNGKMRYRWDEPQMKVDGRSLIVVFRNTSRTPVKRHVAGMNSHAAGTI
jgi:hypothetical protein